MSVYVDNPVYPYRGMIMCHMVADTLDELHQMARKIGINRKWFQNTKHPHYDICKTKRKLALQYGAIEITPRELVAFMRKNNATPNISPKR